MRNGISTNRNLTTYASRLKQSGIDFVFRYYSTTTVQPEKRLTLPEAQALAAAGLEIAVVYEDAPTDLSYFSKSRGYRDGVNAYHYAQQLAQPIGTAIYFAIDYDAAASHISGAIFDYFQGVDQGMRGAGNGSSQYTVGVYGSGAACSWLKSNCSFIEYTWLAESTGWLGSSTYGAWAVMQAQATGPLAGLSKDQYEECQAHDDFGQFTLDAGFILPKVLPALDFNLLSAATKQNILDLLLQEWEFFGEQTMNAKGKTTKAGHKETEPTYFERVGKYWKEGVGINDIDGRDDDIPWSAAFISWVMKTAGAGNRFQYSESHSKYISKAISDRINNNPASFFLGFRLDEYKVQPGDLVCRSRQSNIDYDHQQGGSYLSHGDIVVAVNKDTIDVIGGNVGNSVTKRTLNLDSKGYLTDNSARYFAVIQNKL